MESIFADKALCFSINSRYAAAEKGLFTVSTSLGVVAAIFAFCGFFGTPPLSIL